MSRSIKSLGLYATRAAANAAIEVIQKKFEDEWELKTSLFFMHKNAIRLLDETDHALIEYRIFPEEIKT